ncbi:hypothetical protein BN159_8480 [Streptomyces davaonensis JCM 4913]|uniref:N-acetyltransferase domain-containing protein n=1 Tax=Streptomyces davaonensis (strain DSM 101723 / JCM 4913 / KCC S-0913 / 768) TaxID=1214101 RepID=K4RG32_STRDJ|nr:GNAT family N-acetyltransferase [Streptomyces davaonensis]CCK24404.1 hypothetical protein BN159_0025 [Streptomyces davaonensis JCM 4913]CCK32858.1 hypothetical protein BN159_8480 [Streptomyces davaonensis JCM 4913]
MPEPRSALSCVERGTPSRRRLGGAEAVVIIVLPRIAPPGSDAAVSVSRGPTVARTRPAGVSVAGLGLAMGGDSLGLRRGRGPCRPAHAEGEGAGAGAALSLPVPSGAVAAMVMKLPGHNGHALASMVKYAKIKAVAVSEDTRGRGIGTAVLKRCVQVYRQLDYILLFSGFETSRALGPYDERRGFTVLGSRDTIDVGTVLTGVPMRLGAGPGETFFHRWRGPHR